MKISDYPKFESALSQGRPIIFLCGAGLSVSLGDHAKGWIGWLKEGKAYLSDVEAEELDRRFGSYSASELIDAASFLIEALRQRTMISFWRKLPVWVIIHIICREK